MPNKRFEQTNHGHDSKLKSKARGAVVCRLRAERSAKGGQGVMVAGQQVLVSLRHLRAPRVLAACGGVIGFGVTALSA
jgi:hypothetical protein